MENKKTSFLHPNLLKGNILKSIIFFALPILVSMIFQQLYNAVDTVIVGHFLSEESLAAIGACSSIFELIVGFGTGFGNGLGLVAARAFGGGNTERLKKAVAASLILTLAVTVILTVASVFGMRPLLSLLKTPEQIMDESFSYIIVICIFCGVMFAYNLCSGMLRAIGNSFTPLIFLIFSSLLNIVLDILFITKFNTGIKGAAYATVLAQLISVLLCLIYIVKKAKIIIPSVKEGHFKFEGSLYKDLTGQGLSMALMSSLVSSGTVILQSAINGLGTSIIAGHIATRKIFGISNIPIFTLGMATATFVSQNYGAENFERIKKGIFISCILTTIWAVILIITSPFIITPLISFMSGSSNPEILDYGKRYLTFAYPFFIILGLLVISRNSLQGLGSKMLPLVSSLIELFGKIIFTAFIIPRLGIWGIILCEPLIWCAMGIYLIFACIRKFKSVCKVSE